MTRRRTHGTYPPCYDECPIAKDLFDLVRDEGISNQLSHDAEQAYSAVFCIERGLRTGNAVDAPNAKGRVRDLFQHATQLWHVFVREVNDAKISHEILSMNHRIVQIHTHNIDTLLRSRFRNQDSWYA